MGRTRQKKVQIEHRRTQVSELYLKGRTQAAIASELGVSQATISSDLKAIRKEWRESRICNLDEARVEAVKKLQVLFREAWNGWQRSQEPVETTRIIQKNGEKKAEKTVRQGPGDPRFLQTVHRAIEATCKLLELDAAASAAIERLDEQVIHDKAMAMFWDLIADPPSRDTYDDPIERRLAEEEKKLRASVPDGKKCRKSAPARPKRDGPTVL